MPESRDWLLDVCSGVLRWRGRLDLAIDEASERRKPSGWLRRALLVAAYQLVAQDRAPAKKVVYETVELVKEREGRAPAGFANAILRRVAAHAKSWRELEFDPGWPVPRQAAWASLPGWFWERLVADHGLDWARGYALASLERPRIWARSKDSAIAGAADRSAIAGAADRSAIAGAIDLTGLGPPDRLEGFREGRFFVQDLSSQCLVAEVARFLKEKGAKKVLETCAAPGGKSAGLAWDGFEVTAADREGPRMSLLRDTLARVAPAVAANPRHLDGSLDIPPDARFDAVWVDAPCSASGLVRRHPEIRWAFEPSRFAALRETQRQLVEEARARVASGGALIYSVCSVFREEGPAILADLGLRPVREWWLAPHLEPSGDGFYGAICLA